MARREMEIGSPVGLVFWVYWVLATAVGFTVGAIGVTVVFRAVFPTTGYVSPASPWAVGADLAVGLAAAGAAVGILQWLVLRRRVSHAGWWVFATAVSFPVGLAVYSVVLRTVHFGVGLGTALTVAPATAGATVGILQSLVLIPPVSRAVWWVLATALSSAVGLPATGTVGPPVGGLVVGMITGAVLVWLLRHTVPKPQ